MNKIIHLQLYLFLGNMYFFLHLDPWKQDNTEADDK